MKFASFNDRRLGLKGRSRIKLDNLILDCDNYKIDLLAIQETKNNGPLIDILSQMATE